MHKLSYRLQLAIHNHKCFTRSRSGLALKNFPAAGSSCFQLPLRSCLLRVILRIYALAIQKKWCFQRLGPQRANVVVACKKQPKLNLCV